MHSFVCPLDPLIGTASDTVHARSMEWARQHRLTPTVEIERRLAATRFGDLASRAYPDASVDDRVLAAGWLIYIAVLDDQYDTAPGADPRKMRAMFRSINTYLRTGRFARIGLPKPLHIALADLWKRSSTGMSPTWRLRFAHSMSTFLAGVRTEAEQRDSGRAPSLDGYLRLRRATSATGLLFDLIQLGTHAPLTDAVHFDPAVTRVRETAMDVVAWINDLASMDKEEADGAEHNLVLVLRRSGGLSSALAQAVATDMVNDGIRRLWRDADELPTFGGGLPAYVDGLKRWVRANIDWSAASDRYRMPPSGVIQAGEIAR